MALLETAGWDDPLQELKSTTTPSRAPVKDAPPRCAHHARDECCPRTINLHTEFAFGWVLKGGD